jgi:hypothetical protein
MVCCLAMSSSGQEIRLGTPLIAAQQLLPEGSLIESDSPALLNRVPVPANLGPANLGPANLGPANSQLISFDGEGLGAIEPRPEFPAETLPTPQGQRVEPLTLDWSLIDDGSPPLATVDLPIAGLPTAGCATCGSANVHSRSLSPSQRFTSGLYAALCPCDDCYQPKWDLTQSAAFFVDSARPQTRTRFGWDFGTNMILADRAEYFWARSGQLGPSPNPYPFIVPSIDYHELTMYTEVGKGGFSFFTSLPYRSLYLDLAGHEAGFADMKIGTKSLVHDSRLLQVTFQMTTTIPSAASIKGLGTGHVSLEPALLMALRLTHRDLLQVQLAEWIPIGGDTDYAGALLRWGVSWNRRVWAMDESTQMTANLEVFGWSFQDGAYTDPVLGPFQAANNESYVYLGPGCRLLLCNKWEVGFGGAFALTDRHFAESIVRSEVTLRF